MIEQVRPVVNRIVAAPDAHEIQLPFARVRHVDRDAGQTNGEPASGDCNTDWRLLTV